VTAMTWLVDRTSVTNDHRLWPSCQMAGAYGAGDEEDSQPLRAGQWQSSTAANNDSSLPL
jgi:hypothetical protein